MKKNKMFAFFGIYSALLSSVNAQEIQNYLYPKYIQETQVAGTIGGGLALNYTGYTEFHNCMMNIKLEEPLMVVAEKRRLCVNNAAKNSYIIPDSKDLSYEARQKLLYIKN